MSVAELDRPRDWTGAATATIGGVLVAAGAWLPWITLFAGIQRYAGIAGLYGRVVFAGGALTILGAIAMMLGAPRRIRALIGVLGLILLAMSGWELIGLHATVGRLAEHPLLLVRPGPGLYVALAGAAVVSALLIPFRRSM